jgi:hypothetical protein
VETSFRLWTAGLPDLGTAGVFTVIHFSTVLFVHSFTVVDQLVCRKHPQVYPQDASLAPPGLA